MMTRLMTDRCLFCLATVSANSSLCDDTDRNVVSPDVSNLCGRARQGLRHQSLFTQELTHVQIKPMLHLALRINTMALFLELLFLAVVLLPFFPANGQDPSFAALLTTRTKVQKEIVNKHNELRKSVSPPASNMLKMEWSKEAAANAQKWANKCTLEHSLPEARKTSTKCGENLFMSSYPASWSDAIQNWYEEHHDFVYGVGPKSSDAVVGHYTQVVWYSSYHVGCGIAYCPNQQSLKYYYVCQYCPAGNLLSKIHTPYLKGKSCASCPHHCDNGLCTNRCEKIDDYSNCNVLKKDYTCDHNFVKKNCKASCECEGKIY